MADEVLAAAAVRLQRDAACCGVPDGAAPAPRRAAADGRASSAQRRGVKLRALYTRPRRDAAGRRRVAAARRRRRLLAARGAGARGLPRAPASRSCCTRAAAASQVFEDARMLGVALLHVRGGRRARARRRGLADRRARRPTSARSTTQITDSGAPALLLERYAGRLEYHDPWHVDREVSHLFRGHRRRRPRPSALLGRARPRAACAWSTTAPIHRHATMPGIEQARAYHLLPAQASKARRRRHAHAGPRAARREEVIAVGDSREDMGAAPAVGDVLARAPTRSRATRR